MTIENIKTTLYKLEKLMYGFNYEVCLGIEIFEGCSDIDNFKICLKKTYPGIDLGVSPIAISIVDFWEEINFSLTYRGDKRLGVELVVKNQEAFESLEKEYKNFLTSQIKPNVKIYSYPDHTAIPGYPVWWDYRFIIQSENSYIFIYGSASD